MRFSLDRLTQHAQSVFSSSSKSEKKNEASDSSSLAKSSTPQDQNAIQAKSIREGKNARRRLNLEPASHEQRLAIATSLAEVYSKNQLISTNLQKIQALTKDLEWSQRRLAKFKEFIQEIEEGKVPDATPEELAKIKANELTYDNKVKSLSHEIATLEKENNELFDQSKQLTIEAGKHNPLLDTTGQLSIEALKDMLKSEHDSYFSSPERVMALQEMVSALEQGRSPSPEKVAPFLSQFSGPFLSEHQSRPF